MVRNFQSQAHICNKKNRQKKVYLETRNRRSTTNTHISVCDNASNSMINNCMKCVKIVSKIIIKKKHPKITNTFFHNHKSNKKKTPTITRTATNPENNPY